MKKIFIANWKMFMNAQDAHNFCTDNSSTLQDLTNNNTIILCPSFVSLADVATQLKSNAVAIGAQDCSPFNSGSYTGQVSAQSLQKIGCTYCIIGHYERRLYCAETDEAIAEKAKRLIENNITPILCIGETVTDCIETTTYATLKEQLDPVIDSTKAGNCHSLIIAYEPAWSIGTGVVPTKQYLCGVFSWLHSYITEQLPACSLFLIYGGSISPENSSDFHDIPHLNGYIIGKASTDIHAFKQIVENAQ